jgi:hypothetical protein
MTEDNAKGLICCKFNVTDVTDVTDVAKIKDGTKSVLNAMKSARPIKLRK